MTSGDGQEMTVEGLESLARTYDEKARQCREIGDYLKNQTSSMFWQSNAASSFQQNMVGYQRKLVQFEADFTELSKDVRSRAEAIRRKEQG